MTTIRHNPEIIKRFDRYNPKTSAIILNPNAPPLPEMVLDKEGTYITVEQLCNVIHLGGLLEYTPALHEHMLDGTAHKELTLELTALGYKDYEQVIAVLREHKPVVED